MYKDFLALYHKAFLLAGTVGFNRFLIVLIIDLHEAVQLLRAMNLIFKTVSFTVFAL